VTPAAIQAISPRDSPVRCVSASRSVTSAFATGSYNRKVGRYVVRRSSHFIFPSVTIIATRVAVNDLVLEPISKRVRSSTGVDVPTFCTPYPFA
jgi:hypothetical protein